MFSIALDEECFSLNFLEVADRFSRCGEVNVLPFSVGDHFLIYPRGTLIERKLDAALRISQDVPERLEYWTQGSSAC